MIIKKISIWKVENAKQMEYVMMLKEDMFLHNDFPGFWQMGDANFAGPLKS